jgi:hypothetical protein
LPLHSSYLPLGVPNGLVIHHAQGLTALTSPQSAASFLAPLPGKEEKTSARGVLRTHILYFVICFALLYLFYLHRFISKTQKEISYLARRRKVVMQSSVFNVFQ